MYKDLDHANAFLDGYAEGVPERYLKRTLHTLEYADQTVDIVLTKGWFRVLRTWNFENG